MNEENVVDEVIENTDEVIENSVNERQALTPHVKKLKKHEEAKKLVEEAKSIVYASNNELQDCKLLLEEDLREYIAAKETLKAKGLDEAKVLLTKLEAIDTSYADNEDDKILFEAKEDVKPLVLKDVHSGKTTGFLFSLLAGAATFGGLVYWATEKLGITLDITKVPSNETIQTISGWFGTQVGQSNDAIIGGVAVGVAVLAVMALVYLVRVGLKSGSNLRFAQTQMKETQKYIIHKTNCKAEMDRVDAHISDAVKVLKDYEILLGEQVGKLKRIAHFEDTENSTSNYQEKSIATINETQHLIGYINQFIATPMSEEGSLSSKSTELLSDAKEYIEKLLIKWQ